MERKISTRFSIAGESEYRNAVKGINGELKTLASEMTRTKAEFQGQANSVEALEKKQAILNQQQEKTAAKVAEMRSALENSRAAHEAYGETLEEQSTRTDELKAALEALKTAEGDTTAEQERLTAELERAQEAQDATQRAYDQSQRSVDYWQRSLNYAEGDLFKLNREIEDNQRCLEEAKASADGCASSIDRYGRAMGEAGGETNVLGQIGKAVFGDLGGLLGTGGLVGFALKLIDTVKDLAVEYNASQSSMAISTGATGEELQALNDDLTAVMANAKSARGDVAGVMGALYTQLNLRGDALAQHTAEVEEFSRAVGADMGQAVGVVTQLLIAYGKSADDIPGILDRLTVAGQNSRSGALSLGQSLADASFYAETYGMSLDETLSMLTAFDLAGVDSNLVLRAMRKSYDDLSEGGMTLKQVLEGMRDGTISEGDAIEMFGQKADKMVKAIQSGAVDVDKFTGKLKASEGATAASAKAAETFGQKIKGFWNTIWNNDSGAQINGMGQIIVNQVESQAAAVEAAQERIGRSVSEAGAELYGLMDGFDGTSESLGRLIAYLQDGDNQVLQSIPGYESLLGALLNLKPGLVQLEAQQEKVTAAVRQSVEQITANFNDLSGLTAKDVNDMIKSLQSQESYMVQYAANMQVAANRGVNEGLLKTLQDGSVQSAEILAGLATATDGQIAELNAQWEKTNEGKETFEGVLVEMQGSFKEKSDAIMSDYRKAVANFNQESEAYANGARTLEGVIRAARERSEALSEAMYQAGLNAGRALRQGMDDGSGGVSSGSYSPGGTGSGTDLTGVEGRMDTLQSTIEQGNGPIAFSAITAGVNGELGREKDLRWWSGG